MTSNPFAILDKVKQQISIDEAWDKELQMIKESRIRLATFAKEREARLAQERKKRNPGD